MTKAESGAWPTGIRPGSLERCPGLGGRPSQSSRLDGDDGEGDRAEDPSASSMMAITR
jgi:hypothetical protein